jgi:hypothetical protein
MQYLEAAHSACVAWTSGGGGKEAGGGAHNIALLGSSFIRPLFMPHPGSADAVDFQLTMSTGEGGSSSSAVEITTVAGGPNMGGAHMRTTAARTVVAPARRRHADADAAASSAAAAPSVDDAGRVAAALMLFGAAAAAAASPGAGTPSVGIIGGADTSHYDGYVVNPVGAGESRSLQQPSRCKPLYMYVCSVQLRAKSCQ